MVLEDMPQCDQEELYAQFGTAINILDFTCDETISEYVARENIVYYYIVTLRFFMCTKLAALRSYISAA